MIQTIEGLARITELARRERWLAVLVTTRAGGEPSTSVVNAGILQDPRTGDPVVAFVSRGNTAKLANLRRTPHATLVFRAGWDWISVSGPIALAGPEDPLPGLAAASLPALLRDIYHAAGGVHSDLAAYDREMVADHRTAVLLSPTRFATNPPGTEHQEPEEQHP